MDHVAIILTCCGTSLGKLLSKLLWLCAQKSCIKWGFSWMYKRHSLLCWHHLNQSLLPHFLEHFIHICYWSFLLYFYWSLQPYFLWPHELWFHWPQILRRVYWCCSCSPFKISVFLQVSYICGLLISSIALRCADKIVLSFMHKALVCYDVLKNDFILL